MVLHHAGYHIDTLEDSASAWEALQSKCYDLLVIDHNTQNVSGIDLIQKLHASHMAMPVIMTTRTFPMWELALNPWLYPATVLFKPYSIEQLLGVVETALRTADIACAEFAPPLNLPLTGNLRV
jgi:DNA-binding NtrC family response regulator